jgi:hypothetical protein
MNICGGNKSYRVVLFRFAVLPSSAYFFTVGVEIFFLILLDDTQTHTTFDRTPLDEGSVYHRDLYLTTQTLYKRQTSMPPMGFEPAIPATEQPQTYTLDRAATGIGELYCPIYYYYYYYYY